MSAGHVTSVAVKLMKSRGKSDTDAAAVHFSKEALRVRHLDHPNVIKLLAVCLSSQPCMLVFEYMHVGDLKSFLRSVDGKDSLSMFIRQ